MGKVMDIQCPSCSAPLHFNATLGKMKCDYCDNVFEAKDLKNVELNTTIGNSQEVQVDENYVSYNCPDCGAEIIADENTAATFCLYCGNTAILKNKLSGKFAPNKIIPFKTEKEHAIQAFKNLSKGRPFMPKEFNSEKNIEKITGLYVPFWLYDLKVSGLVQMSGTKVQSWTRGNTHYTKTDYYDIFREGSFGYDMVPVDGSKKFSNDIMNTIEPFNYGEMQDYNPAYLSGYLAEKYDVPSEEAFPEARDRVIKSAEEKMLASATGFSSKTILKKELNTVIGDLKYALLPVWMVNVKYKDKFYLFAMNGQTGEFIGNIPLDKKKVAIWFICILVGCCLVGSVIAYMMYFMGGVA